LRTSLAITLTLFIGRFILFGCIHSQALGQNVSSCSPSKPTRVTATAFDSAKKYRVRYNRAMTRIELIFDHQRGILNQLPKSYDPTIVGSDALIGFLPEKCQPYKSRGILVYVSSRRTNGGLGSGQCGAGSEIYLNFLDTTTLTPKVRSRILVGSCEESIELNNQDVADGVLGNVEVVRGKLTLHFLNYKESEGSPTATVSPDFKRLSFDKELR